MSCEEARERMMDALYSEEMAADSCFQFFKHLDGCRACRREYLELLETRRSLSSWPLTEWSPAEEPAVVSKFAAPALRLPRWDWWGVLPRLAAGLLILVGAVSVLSGLGLWGGDRVTVSQQELAEMMNDLIVVRQAEERRIIGQALVNFADDISRQHQGDRRETDEKFYQLQEQVLDLQELNNRYLKTLASR